MEKFREALKHSDIVKVVLTGVGETIFSSEEVSKYIEELERLAEIGKATEKAYSKGAFLIYDVDENYDGTIERYNCDETIEELLMWLESRVHKGADEVFLYGADRDRAFQSIKMSYDTGKRLQKLHNRICI